MIGLTYPYGVPRGLVQCCCGPTGERRLGGERTEGRGQRGIHSPNTCTWSLESHSVTSKLTFTDQRTNISITSRWWLLPSRFKLFSLSLSFFGKSGKGVKGLVVSPSSFSSFFKKICWVNAFGQWRPISLRFFLRRGISKPIGLFYACAELLTEIFQLSSEAQNARSAAVTSRKFGIWKARRLSRKPGIKGRTFNFSLV